MSSRHPISGTDRFFSIKLSSPPNDRGNFKKKFTFLVIGVHLERPYPRILSLATGENPFLFVHQQPLMPLEGEGLVEPSPLPPVQLQRGGRSVPRHSNGVPLPVVHSYRRQPYIPFLGSQTVQIVAEVQSAVLDLGKTNIFPRDSSRFVSNYYYY